MFRSFKYVGWQLFFLSFLYYCCVKNYVIYKKSDVVLIPSYKKGVQIRKGNKRKKCLAKITDSSSASSSSYSSSSMSSDFPSDLNSDMDPDLALELGDYKMFTDNEYIPPLPPVETWEDILAEEEIRNKKEDPKRDKDDFRLSLENKQKVLDIIKKTRLINHCNYEVQKNKEKNILYFVTPKIGAYCKLMEDDREKMESLVSKVKEKFGKKVEIINLKIDVKMPLFEIFLQANIHTQIKIFYARGRTLQYRLPSVFWTRCEILKKNKKLQEKYGGEFAPGLFPKYDENTMLEIMIECVYNDKYNFYIYDVNLEWENLCGLTPENTEMRKLVHQNIHVPTRMAVIKAFEEGIEDFRDVIKEEHIMMLREERRMRESKDYKF